MPFLLSRTQFLAKQGQAGPVQVVPRGPFMIVDQRDQAPARAEVKGRGRKRGVERRRR